MMPHDDDLLTALRAARPDPDYQPSAASPQARAMLTRVLRSRPVAGPRVSRRKLVLAGVPVMAAAAGAAVVLAVTMASPGASGAGPGVSTVRAAVLDAFQRDSGDVIATVRTIRMRNGRVIVQRTWTYPAFPVAGKQVRFRLFDFLNGVPVEDTESIYIADAASTRLSMRTTQGPRSAETIDVDYASRTWSRQRTHSVSLASSLSPSLIRAQVASGGFTVVGTVRWHGRNAVELTWFASQGPTTMKTTLWVDARTYTPLQSVWTMGAGPGNRVLATLTTDYKMLPATPASLALLNPPIPAGFTRTKTSPGFSFTLP